MFLISVFLKVLEGENIRRVRHVMGFPDDSDHKESACNAGDMGSIPGLGRSFEEGNDNPL